MPTYAYTCTACDHSMEVKQSFTDDALTECPECAGRLRKVFNSVGVVFKGSGFYRTDSRGDSKGSDGKGSDAKGTGKDAGSGGNGSTGSADKAPAAAAASSSSSSSSSSSGGSSGGSSSSSAAKPAASA